MRARTATPLLAIVFPVVVWAQAQPQIPTGSATISGTVIDAATKEPVHDAVVTLMEIPEGRIVPGGSPFGSRTAQTGNDGIYRFENVDQGEYRVIALAPTHVRGCFGSSDLYRPDCQSVVAVPLQHREGVTIALQRGGIIRGFVRDHEGRPVERASVLASPVNSDTIQVLLGPRFGSDAEGFYEIANVAPGSVILAVRVFPDPAKIRSHPPVYYPGVVDRSEAARLDVTAGAVIDADIVIPPIMVSAIRATIVGAPDLDDIKLTMVGPAPTAVRNMTLTKEGIGVAEHLGHGRYALAARTQSSASEKLVAWEVVDLSQETLELSMALQPAGRVHGRVVAERGGLPPIEGARVAAIWTYDGDDIDPLVANSVAIGPDGRFELDGLFGMRMFRLLGLPPEWQVSAVLAARADVTSGLDVAPGSSTEVTIVLSQ